MSVSMCLLGIRSEEGFVSEGVLGDWMCGRVNKQRDAETEAAMAAI